MKRKKAEFPLVPSPLRRRSRWNLSYLISFCILLSSWCPVFDQHTRKHAERLKSLYVLPRVQEEAGEATVVPGWPVATFASTWCWTVGRYDIHTSSSVSTWSSRLLAAGRHRVFMCRSSIHTHVLQTSCQGPHGLYRLDRLMGCSAGLVLAHQGSIGDAATFIYTSKGNRRGCRRTRTRRTAGCGSRLAVARDPLPFLVFPSILVSRTF